MEETYWYKDYRITYYTIGGNTIVDGYCDHKRFTGMGKIRGDKAARKYIDLLESNK